MHIKLFAASAVLSLTMALHATSQETHTAKEIAHFKVDRAEQGIAVDADCFYVINSSSITKHDKKDGHVLASYDSKPEGVKHMNSGVVLDGRLYCANSNYPESPMAGSIEIFDVNTLTHVDNHSFGIAHGSVTWIDRHEGFWYVAFANYSGNRSSENRDTKWTNLVKYTTEWQEVGGWIFPADVIAAFMPMSNSGGAWGADGLLYCTGHDKPEVYVMQLPKTGYTLLHLATIPLTIYGQGIAFDRSIPGKKILYGLSRASSTIIVSELN